jgi:tetratricopeptide (TPR) repeat protein
MSFVLRALSFACLIFATASFAEEPSQPHEIDEPGQQLSKLLAAQDGEQSRETAANAARVALQLKRQKRFAEAAAAFGLARDIYAHLNDGRGAVLMLIEKARVLKASGRTDAAARIYRELLSVLAADLPNPHAVRSYDDVTFDLAALHAELGNPEISVEVYKRAAATLRERRSSLSTDDRRSRRILSSSITNAKAQLARFSAMVLDHAAGLLRCDNLGNESRTPLRLIKSKLNVDAALMKGISDARWLSGEDVLHLSLANGTSALLDFRGEVPKAKSFPVPTGRIDFSKVTVSDLATPFVEVRQKAVMAYTPSLN